MNTLREAAQQALEAWQTSSYGQPSHQKAMVLAMTALRTALAEQPAEQMPVAWQWLNTANFRKKLPADANKAEWNPLYAAPQPRKRLTEAEIDAIWRTHLHRDSRVRAIEAAVWGEQP